MRHSFSDPTAGDDSDYLPLTKEETKYIYLTAIIALAVTGVGTWIISLMQ
jgi:hypothetical protein